MKAKASRNARPVSGVPPCVEFYHAGLDKSFRIENHPDGVVIRTDNTDHFSEAEKRFLVRHLAAEGFVDDRYRWFFESDAGMGSHCLKWITDASWIRPHLKITRLKARFTRPVIATSGLILLVLLILFATHVLAGLR